jgi:hypothetical protein
MTADGGGGTGKNALDGGAGRRSTDWRRRQRFPDRRHGVRTVCRAASAPTAFIIPRRGIRHGAVRDAISDFRPPKRLDRSLGVDAMSHLAAKSGLHLRRHTGLSQTLPASSITPLAGTASPCPADVMQTVLRISCFEVAALLFNPGNRLYL